MRNPIVKLVIFLVIMAIILITLITLEQRRRQPEFSPVFFSQAPVEALFQFELPHKAPEKSLLNIA